MSNAAWASAARLVRRSGFGATGVEVDACLKVGTSAYVASALAADQGSDSGATATPPPTLPVLSPPGRGADIATKKAYQQALSAQQTELTGWWLQRMVAVQTPLIEKLTFAWHNHFATSADKVRQAGWMLQQNQTLRRLGRGSFRALALAQLTDAAMLRWLDGEDNVVGAPNENLSREFMELFALGHGNGYTETDVREGARALTGWTIQADGSTVLRPRRHDNGSKTFLGVTGNLDTVGYRDAVWARAGSYVPARWWGQLVSDTAPSTSQLAAATTAFHADDLSGLFAALFNSPDFAAAEGSLVIGPVEWLVGTLRALAVPVTTQNSKQLLAVLQQLGQVPFHPPSVGGWPSGAAWLSTAAADARMRTALSLVAANSAAQLNFATAAADPVEAIAYQLGVAQFCDRSVAAIRAAGTPRAMVAVALNTPEYLVH